jgi:hypothetical protein
MQRIDDPKGLLEYLPAIPKIENHQTAIAKDEKLLAAILDGVKRVPTHHRLVCQDATKRWPRVEPESVHLVLTSPPYWTLKEYRVEEGQLGYVENYDLFHRELNKVWRQAYQALVPGGAQLDGFAELLLDSGIKFTEI